MVSCLVSSRYTRRNRMNTFKLEVGSNCVNGAKVLALYVGPVEGVVLAELEAEYATWEFRTDNQSSTFAGHYFVFDSSLAECSNENAWDEARNNFLLRVEGML